MHTWVNLSLAFTAFVTNDKDNDATLTILYPVELDALVLLSFANSQLVMGVESENRELVVSDINKEDYQRKINTYFFGIRISESHDMFEYAMHFFSLRKEWVY